MSRVNPYAVTLTIEGKQLLFEIDTEAFFISFGSHL